MLHLAHIKCPVNTTVAVSKSARSGGKSGSDMHESQQGFPPATLYLRGLEDGDANNNDGFTSL